MQDCEKKRRSSLPFLDVKLLKTSKHGSLRDQLLVLTKSMIFHDFHKMRQFLHLLDEKLPAHATQRKRQTSGSVSSRACTRSLVTNQINTYEKVKLYILLGTLPFVEAFFPRV